MKNLNYYKSAYDKGLVRKEFEGVEGYIIEFSTPPPVMCSGAVFPEQDFNGALLQDIVSTSVVPDFLSFASFYGGERGIVAFSWLSNNGQACRRFIESLKCIPDEAITAALLRFFFEHCENVHIAPNWWDSLSNSAKEALVNRLDVAADISRSRPDAVLVDDGVSFKPWLVERRFGVNN